VKRVGEREKGPGGQFSGRKLNLGGSRALRDPARDEGGKSLLSLLTGDLGGGKRGGTPKRMSNHQQPYSRPGEGGNRYVTVRQGSKGGRGRRGGRYRTLDAPFRNNLGV